MFLKSTAFIYLIKFDLLLRATKFSLIQEKPSQTTDTWPLIWTSEFPSGQMGKKEREIIHYSSLTNSHFLGISPSFFLRRKWSQSSSKRSMQIFLFVWKFMEGKEIPPASCAACVNALLATPQASLHAPLVWIGKCCIWKEFLLIIWNADWLALQIICRKVSEASVQPTLTSVLKC